MAGFVHIPWYATALRNDQFEEVLAEVAPIAMRYGATSYELFRSREDAYKFLQVAEFEQKLDFDRYWTGPEFCDFRARHQGWFQVPVLYSWHDRVVVGSLATELVA